MNSKDYPALAECFAMDGAEPETQRMVWRVLDQMVRWQDHKLEVTERKKQGPFFMEKEGRRYTFNGEWAYQVHLKQVGMPGREFVFPAGLASSGRHAILLTVPAKD